MHFLLFSFYCVPDISNFSDILFNLRLFVTVLHLDFISVWEGVAVDDPSSSGFGCVAVDGCGSALLVDGCGTALLVEGCGPALLVGGCGTALLVDGCGTSLLLDGFGTALLKKNFHRMNGFLSRQLELELGLRLRLAKIYLPDHKICSEISISYPSEKAKH